MCSPWDYPHLDHSRRGCMLPKWFSGKESACNAGDAGSIPGLGRSPGGGDGNPFQYSCLGNTTDRGAWQVAKSHTRLSTHAHTHMHTSASKCHTQSVSFSTTGPLSRINPFPPLTHLISGLEKVVPPPQHGDQSLKPAQRGCCHSPGMAEDTEAR